MENNYLVDTVDELRSESFCTQAQTKLAIVHTLPLTPNVAGHDNNSVLEVDRAPLTIS
jgi:hypothetical protein